MDRLFTVTEARALLPVVRTLTESMCASKAEFDRHREAFELLRDRADASDRFDQSLARHLGALQRLAAEVQRAIDVIKTLGVEVKGIDQGLLDFPSERGGRVVYLCWKRDEPDIAYWHDIRTGFAGRRPLAES
jgi:hypothetical protein